MIQKEYEIEEQNYIVPIEVIDFHRILVRMVTKKLITSSDARKIINRDLKVVTLGYKNIVIDNEVYYREHWKLPTGAIVTFNKQFDSRLW